MSSTYPFTRTVNDSDLMFTYIKNSLPTIVSLVYDGVVVQIGFQATLTAGNQTLLAALVAAYVDPIKAPNSNLASQSIFNCTSTALAANAIYTGNWEDVSCYSSLRVTVTANTLSTIGGISLQYGISLPQADIVKTYTLTTAGDKYTFINTVVGRYFRVVYQNGATAQNNFQLSTFWSTTTAAPIVQGNEALYDQSDCNLTRSVLCGRSDYQQYHNLRVDEQGQVRVRVPANFERNLSTESIPIVQVSFTYAVNSECTSSIVTGSGSITPSLGRAIISTGATINSSASLSTSRLCRCSAGNTITTVFGCAFTTGRAGSTQVAGVGNSANGLFVGYNGTSFGIMFRTNSVSTWIPQTSFNIDPLNGTGPSGINIAPNTGNTYVISYDATGYGTACFMLLSPIRATNARINMPECVYMHRVSFANTASTLGILNPQFPCAAIATNTTNNTNMTISVASFSAFTDGPPRRALLLRALDNYKTISTATYTPIIVLQNKTTFNGVPNTISVHLRELCISTLGGNKQILYIGVFEDAVITGATYTDANTTNSCLSYSVTATSTMTVDTGILLYACNMFTSDGRLDITEHDLILSPGSTFCIAGKLSAIGSANASVTVTYSEFQ